MLVSDLASHFASRLALERCLCLVPQCDIFRHPPWLSHLFLSTTGMNATLCPAEPNPDYCASVLANPDISGIGVRISVYVQVGLNVVCTFLD
ncbi:hypothetical protein RSOLAG1IB_08129 [Rhizoctonia solani AG-1 IB]|uniref:Uncharacterized protein n=1 Tax=Thanatephorus cucumeris (strain AG1-IB / isolate 7/3/14) TaxID=1108050 RepID=A0A0B7FFP2_THACB|nr:hypothetical protein RSOLAG1IB_08129 [Rhizoctonia solani AG-1 IB]